MGTSIGGNTIRKALLVSMTVGTILLVINQFDAVFGHEEIRILPAVLTYLVPFVVFISGNKLG